MADALIGATIQVALEKALSLAANRFDLLLGFKDDLAGMKESLELIRAVLADAEQKQGQRQAVQRWLKSLEGVALDAENVLDEINYENLRREVESQNRLKRKVCCFFFISNCVTFRWRMASKVRDVNLKLHNISQKANELGLVQMAAVDSAAIVGDKTSRQTDSIVAPMIGRDDDVLNIVEILLSPSEKAISVLPVIGMGGMGKTTLAKSIYNNKQIDEHFGQKKIWVCVSKKVQIVELFKLILVQLTKEKVEVDDRNVIVERIRKQLGEKRYFLVLDDAWNVEPDFWNDFFTTFNGLNPTIGSWCLVTSRLQRLADTVSRLLIMDVKPYFLGGLSAAECWCIVKEKAIGREEVPAELEAIRDRVIKRCDGLPLAANLIGGLLCLNAKEHWLSIVEKSLLRGGDVDQVIKVSFDYLSPAPVKKCFAYCSIFPEDTEMERDSLIELWMAEGFLLPDLENKTVMEKVGEEYIRVLLQSSLLEETRNIFGQVRYKMHDLVHGLTKSISKSKSINLETDAIDNVNEVRYLNISSSGENSVKILENISTSLRTLFLNSGISGNMLSMYTNLHVLNLSNAQIRELSTSIGKLIHLRLIDLSGSGIQTLPKSLCKLYNLQTLRMNYCGSLNGLPKRMGNLISLRHLHCNIYRADFEMPPEMGRLTCLQTLEFFNIGQEKGRRIEELGCLKDLKGRLEIHNLELVKGKEKAEKASLNRKAHLLRLGLTWSNIIREGDSSREEDVLEGLQPHPNLQELLIASFMGDQFPGWLMNLSRLVELELRDCKRCTELPVALGQKPFLKNLKLSGLESITCIGLSFYGIDDDNRSTRELFPALKVLRLENMKNLVEWMGVEMRSTTSGGEAEVDVFPVLEVLTIDDCPLLTTAPSHFHSLKRLQIYKNDHVLVVKNIICKATATLSDLEIEGMAELTCLSDIVAAPPPAGAFQNLKQLSLWSCPNLTSLFPEALPNLTSLEVLSISECHELTNLPGRMLQSCTTLRRLLVFGCPNLTSLFPEALPNLTSLEALYIRNCDGLTNLPGRMLQSCTSLWELKVIGCRNLVSFPADLQLTPSLSEVWLCCCPKLKTNMTPKGFGFLTSLRDLRIGPFSDDDDDGGKENSSIYNEFDWSGLRCSSTLRELKLYGLPHMESSLPHQLQDLTTLTELSLYDFGGIEALPDWLGNLASLEELELRNCKKLGYLPSMDAMRRLTKLSHLEVRGCPLLRERCTPSQTLDSSEWSKISHIPYCTFG